MRISDLSSDVGSSDLPDDRGAGGDGRTGGQRGPRLRPRAEGRLPLALAFRRVRQAVGGQDARGGAAALGAQSHADGRGRDSAEKRRVGEEGGSTRRSQWWPFP